MVKENTQKEGGNSTLQIIMQQTQRQEMQMFQRIPAERVRKLAQRWEEQNAKLDFYVPDPLKGRLSEVHIRRELKKLGDFEEGVIKKVLREMSKNPAQFPSDEPQALILGVNHKAVGSGFLAEATRAGLETVWIDISQTACLSVWRSLLAQWRELKAKGERGMRYRILQAEIRNLLIAPDEWGLDLENVNLWVVPMTLGYLGETTTRLVLHEAGLRLAEDADLESRNRLVLIGQWWDYNPRGTNSILGYYRIRDLMARVRRSAGRKVEVVSEEKLIYFGEVVSALTIKAK